MEGFNAQVNDNEAKKSLVKASEITWRRNGAPSLILQVNGTIQRETAGESIDF
jgi:hypothetical protein